MATRKFKEDSSLLPFLSKDNNNVPDTITTIIAHLIKICRSQQMLDENNPEIIYCSPELENIFGMSTIHVSQLRNLLLDHLVPVSESCDTSTYNKGSQEKNSTSLDNPKTEISKPPSSRCSTKSKTNATEESRRYEPRYSLSRKFFEVMKTVVTDLSAERTVTFLEAAGLLSKYIIANKEKLFDPRNIYVAKVENDPLGEVFGVRAFHQTQAKHYLKKQLIPVAQCTKDADNEKVDPGMKMVLVCLTKDRSVVSVKTATTNKTIIYRDDQDADLMGIKEFVEKMERKECRIDKVDLGRRNRKRPVVQQNKEQLNKIKRC